jgi:hypothetical protein
MPRYWFALYTFVLSYSALIDMFLNRLKWIDHPVRPLPSGLNMSLIYIGVLYPLLAWLYMLNRNRGISSFVWGLLISLGFSLMEAYLFVPLHWVNYKNWNSFYTFLINVLFLWVVESFLRFYQKKAGGLW